MRPRRLRSLCDWSEQEIILPDGPYAGRRFRLDRSPAARLLFKELDSGRWPRSFVTGPNQDGKSLIGFVIPTLHRLFERRETVLMGVPNADIVHDKWTVNLRPAIWASRYRDLLPASGRGSRGGNVVGIEFRNGAYLRFMTGGGDDQSRASFTTPNLSVTETDGFDEVGGTSREGDKFSQLERRLLAFGERARLLAECTVSTEKGRTWLEYQHGTQSRICIPCPHCHEFVTPEREHIVGWQDAQSEREAIDRTCIICPACGSPWKNDERLNANRHAVLAHKGQTVDRDGNIHGDVPPTNTLGFRWTVVNSVLNPERLSLVGGEEWRAKRAADEDVAERDLRQKQWALPAKPAKVDLSQLDAFGIMRRTLSGVFRGICPEGTECVTVGCDIGKWLCHWVAVAWRKSATPHVIDYGRLEVPSAQMSVEDAILTALRDWRDETVNRGWPCGDQTMVPLLRFVDSGEWRDTIMRFIAESGERWFATRGFGIGQRREGQYKRDTGSTVTPIAGAEKYSHVRLPTGQNYIEIGVDFWKSWLHSRIHTPIEKPGALTLFDSTDHLSFAKHLTAEKQVEEFVPREGTVVRWEAVNRNNHWLDAMTLACVAGHAAGVRLLQPMPTPPQSPPGVDSDAALKPADWLKSSRKW